jgi:hypothetical protein
VLEPPTPSAPLAANPACRETAGTSHSTSHTGITQTEPDRAHLKRDTRRVVPGATTRRDRRMCSWNRSTRQSLVTPPGSDSRAPRSKGALPEALHRRRGAIDLQPFTV